MIHHLQLHLQPCFILTSQRISKFSWSWAPSVPPNSFTHHFHVHITLASMCISVFAWSLPSSVPQTLHYYGHHVHMVMASQVYLQSLSITTSKTIQLWPSSSSQIWLNHGIQMNLWVNMIVTFSHISNCSKPQYAASSDIPRVDG